MAAEEWVGRVIDQRYVVEGVLGQGGMGFVLRAKHRFTGQHVALKLLKSELSQDPAIQSRFLAEAQAPSAIGHPGIVRVLDAGRDQTGFLYLVMELLEGRSLRVPMSRGELTPLDARRIMLELLETLAAAHARGFVHRDLKPDNVFLVAPTGSARLLDFGIAKVLDAAMARVRTATGVTLGTPAYMSPEQLSDAAGVDARTDLWACGVIIFEMLSGRLPFRADRMEMLLVAIATQSPDPIRAHVPNAPPELDAFFSRALARDPRMRFGAATEMAQALGALPLGAMTPRQSSAAAVVTPPASYATSAPRGASAAGRPSPMPHMTSAAGRPSPMPAAPTPAAIGPYSAAHGTVGAAATPMPAPGSAVSYGAPPQPPHAAPSTYEIAPPAEKSRATLIVGVAAAIAVAVLVVLLVMKQGDSDGNKKTVAHAGSGSSSEAPSTETKAGSGSGSATTTPAPASGPSGPTAITMAPSVGDALKGRLAKMAEANAEDDAKTKGSRTTRPPKSDPGPKAEPRRDPDPEPPAPTHPPAGSTATTEPTCEQTCAAAARCGLGNSACVAQCRSGNRYGKECLDAAGTNCHVAARCLVKLACGSEPSGTGTCPDAFACQVGTCAGNAVCGCRCMMQMSPASSLALMRVNNCLLQCVGVPQDQLLQCVESKCTASLEACKAQ